MLLRETSNCPPICVKFGLNGAACAMIASSRLSLGMAEAGAGMLHDVEQNLRRLLEELRVRLLPLAQRAVSLLGIFNRVGHRLSK